jgi:hypothetical protein
MADSAPGLRDFAANWFLQCTLNFPGTPSLHYPQSLDRNSRLAQTKGNAIERAGAFGARLASNRFAVRSESVLV